MDLEGKYHPKESHVMAALLRRFLEAVRNSENKVICWGSGKPLRDLCVDDLGKNGIICSGIF